VAPVYVVCNRTMTFFGSLQLRRLYRALSVASLAFVCVSILWIYISSSVERRSHFTREHRTAPQVCNFVRVRVNFDEVGVYLKHDAWTALLAVEAVPASVHANERRDTVA